MRDAQSFDSRMQNARSPIIDNFKPDCHSDVATSGNAIVLFCCFVLQQSALSYGKNPGQSSCLMDSVLPRCRICRSPRMRFVTDFGRLAITNQFARPGDAPAHRHRLAWNVCDDCGLVQLVEPPPLQEIQPRFPWITYQEPERHLDETAAIVKRLAGLSRTSHVIGLTYKDQPLLDRLSDAQVRLLDAADDLEITSTLFGLETLQAAWTVERARQIRERYGAADVLVTRHVLEHTFDTTEFLMACRTLLAPDGLLVMEVPDCERAFKDVELSVIWEEHVLYFTEPTLRSSLTAAGFETRSIQRANYPIEDCLVWFGQTARSAHETAVPARSTDDVEVIRAFADGWRHRADTIRTWAAAICQAGGRLAVFGAGHRAVTLIDLAGIAEYIDCVIDDSPDKQQLLVAAGQLPIFGSQALMDRQITCCLLVVNPDAEDRIISRQQQYAASGGTFVSYYPASLRALRWS